MNTAVRNIWVVAKREFTDYFTSPVAYVFLVIFLTMCSFFTFQGSPIQGMRQTPFFDLNEASLASFFPLLPLMFLILVPAIGMRLWSQEKRTGTLELLLTLPITPAQAVIGKFFASWVFLILALALTFPLWITASILGSPDHQAILCGYLGGVLMAGAYLAIGCMTSAMARDQVVSFILSFTVCSMTFLAGYMPVVEALQDLFPNNIALVDFISTFSVVTHFESFQQGIFHLRDFVFFASAILIALVVTTVLVREHQGTGILQLFARNGLIVGPLALILVLVNMMSHSSHTKIDMTDNAVHTLNEGTKNILLRLREERIKASHKSAEIDKITKGIKSGNAEQTRAIARSGLKLDPRAFQVEIRLFFTQSDDWGRSFKFVREYTKRVEGLIEEYKNIAGGDIIYNRINPQPDTDEAVLAEKANLHPIPVTAEDHGYLGMTLSYGDRSQQVALLNMVQTGRGAQINGVMPDEQWEYAISKAIAQLLPRESELPVVGLMSPMQVEGGFPPGIPPQMRNRFPNKPEWAIREDLRRMIGQENVRTVPFSSSEIDPDIDLLVVIHPKEITDRVQFAIDQFVLRGGKLLAYIDPMHAFDLGPLGGFGAPSDGGSQSDMEKLLSHWGVNFLAEQVVVDKDLAYRPPAQLGGGTWPTMLEIDSEHHSGSEPITRNLGPVTGIHFGTFQIMEAAKKNKSLTLTELFYSSKNSMLATTSTNALTLTPQSLGKFGKSQRDSLNDFPSGGDKSKKILGLKIAGKFTTAFPDGDPEFVADANATVPAFLRSAAPNANPIVVLLGDVDMIHQGTFGLASQGGLGNRRFFLRLVDYLTGDEDLLRIRTANKRTRPLTALKKREEKTLEKFRKELTKAEEDQRKNVKKLNDVMNTIIQKATEAGQIQQTSIGALILLSQQDQDKKKKAEDKIEATNSDLKKTVRAIKKREKHAITSLRNGYKWTNILLVPIAIVLLGVVVILIRRQRIAAR